MPAAFIYDFTPEFSPAAHYDVMFASYASPATPSLIVEIQRVRHVAAVYSHDDDIREEYISSY